MSKNFKGWENYKPTGPFAKKLEIISKDLADLQNGKSKYGNKKTEVDGILFDSKKEANRYRELKIMEKAGLITDLRLQVVHLLTIREHLICKYIADFEYWEKGKPVVEDVKGHRTREYSIKRKLMLAIHGIKIKEI